MMVLGGEEGLKFKIHVDGLATWYRMDRKLHDIPLNKSINLCGWVRLEQVYKFKYLGFALDEWGIEEAGKCEESCRYCQVPS